MQHTRYYWLLTLLCLCLYLPGLANLPLFDRDEPHFAQASRQMLETHHYWQINFQAQPRHLKPPGIYWLQATAVRTFSSAESTAVWPYRLPSVLGALSAVLLTFWFGRRLTDSKTAALASIFLACSVLLIIEAHLAVTDTVLLMTMITMQAALAQIYQHSFPDGGSKGERAERLPLDCEHRLRRAQHKNQEAIANGNGWPLIFWVAMAAGIFVKGITPLVGGLTILGLYIADRQTAWLKALRLSWGIPLLLFLTASWLIPFSLASGHNFLWDMIRGDVLPKLAGGQQSHGMPPGYFTLILTPMFWPASVFIVPTAVWAWRHRQDRTVRFLLAWILPTWIFFEIVPTKLPEYVLPVYPAIALLTALTVTEGVQQLMKRWMSILQILQHCLWIVCTLALITVVMLAGGWGWLTAMVMLGATGYLLYLYYHPARYRRVAVSVIIAACAFIPMWQFVLPNIHSIWISGKLANLIAQTAPEAPTELNPVFAVDYQEPSLVFLLGTYRVQMSRIAETIARGAEQPKTVLIISEQDLPCVMALLEEKDLTWRSLGRLKGFNYNQRHTVILNLILISGPANDLANTNQPNFLAAMARNRDHQFLYCGSFLNNFHSPNRGDSTLLAHYFPIA